MLYLWISVLWINTQATAEAPTGVMNSSVCKAFDAQAWRPGFNSQNHIKMSGTCTLVEGPGDDKLELGWKLPPSRLALTALTGAVQAPGEENHQQHWAAQARWAHLCNGGQSVPGSAALSSCVCSTKGSHIWYDKPSQKPVTEEVMGPGGEATVSALLNGHATTITLPSKYLYL